MADDPELPDVLDLSAMENVCRDTAEAWLWYCDVHNTHGNADSKAEAEALDEAHTRYWNEHHGEECDVIVWQRTTHERA
jgi:hypothetical protein